jgi:aspartyl-tRNA(Asn)/glutamyl-tRNA(Gln) amidotransferase subunit A
VITGRETIVELAEAIRERRVRAVDAVRAAFESIRRHDGRIHSFRELYEERSMEAAEAIDARTSAGEHLTNLPLPGIPIALKDNIATDFGHTTCASRILENYRSPFCATAARRLIAAGAIIVGKTNMDEFAMGSSNENSAYGPTLNPFDFQRVPGGSSGGSAAAVAAGFVPGALGSETGGSVRQPAAMCGVVGVKPTYGLVSRYGLVAFGSSLDQIGPIARSVKDAALLLSVIAGHDPLDSTSARLPRRIILDEIDDPIENLRLGVPRQYRSDANEPEVSDAIEGALEVYRKLGAEIIDIELPLLDYGIATYYVIAPAEASSNLARFDGIRYGHRASADAEFDLYNVYARSRAEGFGPEVRRRIMLGTYVLSSGYYDAYYKRALQVRRLIKEDFDRAFETCDAIIGPTAPTVAFPIGSRPDPMSMYLNDIYTATTNIAGICGISIPAAVSQRYEKPLPIGLQVQCRAFDEMTMFRVARMFEQNAGGIASLESSIYA